MTAPPAEVAQVVLAVPAGTALAPVGANGDRLGQLAGGWLLSYRSPHTRRAYARDLTAWASWCARLDVDPLAADRVHVDAWSRQLSEGLHLARGWTLTRPRQPRP